MKKHTYSAKQGAPDDDELTRPLRHSESNSSRGSAAASSRSMNMNRNRTVIHSREPQSRSRSRSAMQDLEEEANRPTRPPARSPSSISQKQNQTPFRFEPINRNSHQPQPVARQGTANGKPQSFDEVSLRDESVQSTESSDAGSSVLDMVLAKRYYANGRNSYAPVSSQSRAIPQQPTPPFRVPTTPRNTPPPPSYAGMPDKSGCKEGLIVDNNLAELVMSHQKAAGQSHQQRHTEELSISDTSSFVPPPPVLQQQRHFSQPGAFRMSRGRIRRSTDANSLISSSTNMSQPRHSRTRQQIIEANLVEDLLPDDECPSPPLTLNFTSSMGTHMTATTTTTASPLSVVEAQPMDESNTLRAFFRNRKVKFFILLLISFFLVLVLGTVYALTGFGLNKFDQSNQPSSPTQAPTSPGDVDLDYFVHIALPEYTRQSLRYENSAQSKALAWLKNNTFLESYSLEKRLQRFALATFFYATSGERRWENKDGWLSDLDECSWYTRQDRYSSICDEEGVYEYLSLGNNQLRGALPDELSLLSSLKILKLPINILTGSIPSRVAELKNLKEILLYDNFLGGSLPEEFGEGLDQLETLDIEFNFVAQNLPNSIGRMKNLKHLMLGRNLLVGTVPPSLRQLRNLEVLYLHENAFSGFFPDSLGSTLTHVRLDENFFSGKLPSNVWSTLPNLEELILGNNTFTGTLPTEMFQSCRQLHTIDMYRNSLTGSIATEIGLASNLRSLYLEKNSLKGKLPVELGRLTKLNTLWLHANGFKGSIPDELGLIGTNLVDVDLSQNGLSGSLPASLGNLDAKILYFASNSLTGAVPASLGNLGNLQRLALESNLIMGDMPPAICNLVTSGGLVMHNLTVDCGRVRCPCCKDCGVSELGV